MGGASHRKIITHAIVFLLLGAIVNVAVAWGCVWVQPQLEPWLANHNPTANPLIVVMTMRFGVAAVEQVERSGTFLDRWPEDVHVIDSDIWWSKSTLIHTGARSYAMAAGWPKLSLMAWGNTLESHGAHHVVYCGLTNNVELKSNVNDGPCPRVFPLRPIWPGFAVNTLFYMRGFCGCCSPRHSRCGDASGGDASNAACARRARIRLAILRCAPSAVPLSL